MEVDHEFPEQMPDRPTGVGRQRRQVRKAQRSENGTGEPDRNRERAELEHGRRDGIETIFFPTLSKFKDPRHGSNNVFESDFSEKELITSTYYLLQALMITVSIHF